MYPEGPAEITECTLDRSMIAELADEAGGNRTAVPTQIGFRDDAIAGLVGCWNYEQQ